MSIEDFIIIVYCLVDIEFKKIIEIELLRQIYGELSKKYKLFLQNKAVLYPINCVWLMDYLCQFATLREAYYGFKGNLVISSEGIIIGITVTTAKIDERESLWDIIDNIHGLLIADKGLIDEDYQFQI